MTHFSQLLTDELDAYRERVGASSVAILETGSIRNEAEEYHQNDGWSTLTFAEYVRDNGGSLTSVDLDITAAHKVLMRHELHDRVNLVQQHSIEFLAGEVGARTRYDVILLDSANDADLILHSSVSSWLKWVTSSSPGDRELFGGTAHFGVRRTTGCASSRT